MMLHCIAGVTKFLAQGVSTNRKSCNEVAKACEHGFDCCVFTTKHDSCKTLRPFCATCEFFACSIACQQSCLLFVPGKALPSTRSIASSQGRNLFIKEQFLGSGS